MRWEDVVTIAARLKQWGPQKDRLVFYADFFGSGWNKPDAACPGCRTLVDNEDRSNPTRGHCGAGMTVEQVLEHHPDKRTWSAQILLVGGGID